MRIQADSPLTVAASSWLALACGLACHVSLRTYVVKRRSMVSAAYILSSRGSRGGRGEFAGRTIGARLDSRWRDAIAHHYHERPRGYQHHRERRVLATVVAVVVAVALVSATLLSLAPPYSSGV